jgi:hypothetical protein
MLWLSQALIAELFQVTVPTVNEHDAGRRVTMEFFRIIQNRLHFAATGNHPPLLRQSHPQEPAQSSSRF